MNTEFDETNLVGKRFGERTVLGPSRRGPHREKQILCTCDQGHERWVAIRHLRAGTGGNCRTCSCSRAALSAPTLHPLRHTLAYRSWLNMRARTNHDESYVRRGITCCDRWQSFDFFLEDMGEPVPPRVELDRIDGNKGYFKDNCRWATHQENNANRTNLRMITYDGKTMCVAHWEKYLGVKLETLRKKLRFNRPLSVIMTELGYKS